MPAWRGPLGALGDLYRLQDTRGRGLLVCWYQAKHETFWNSPKSQYSLSVTLVINPENFHVLLPLPQAASHNPEPLTLDHLTAFGLAALFEER